MNTRRILLSLASIIFVGSLAAGGTGAFFSDEETSEGNRFTAGALDLKVDSVAHYNGLVCFEETWHPEETVTWNGTQLVLTGVDVQEAIDAYNDPADNPAFNPLIPAGSACGGTWELTDLGPEKTFFDYADLKPGDNGENTISLHVEDNDSYVCAAIHDVSSDDNGINEPEGEAGDVTDGEGAGELDDELNFLIWEDDGDNALETPELENIIYQGLAAEGVAGVYPLYTPATGAFTGGTTGYLGVYWCYGAITVEGTDITCDGALVTNLTQTDSLEADFTFYVEQSRNNEDFACPPLEDFEDSDDDAEEREEVGADLAFVPLDLDDTVVCDETVGSAQAHATIQEGINAASDGETVCVAEGVYNEDVLINKSITLSGDGASATSEINGQAGGQGAAVTIAADDVTVEGFEINGAGIAALWLETGVSGATVRSNRIVSAAGVTAVTAEGSQSNHVFTNNEFVGNGASQIVYVNGTASLGQASANVDFLQNSFSGTIVGGGIALGNEATAADIKNNDFASSITSTYAILESFEDDALVNFNNFNGAGGVKVRDGDAGAGPLNAENNWWGAAVPVGHFSGDVDDDPKEASAFPLI